MTSEEFIKEQKRIFQQIIEKDIPLRRAAQDTLSKQVTRIFVDGKNSADASIGQYDTTTPFYINPNQSPAANKSGKGAKFPTEGLKPPRGKHGDTEFKSGKKHKTTFVNNYKDFRNRIGRRIDRVDLFLSGDLKSDFSNAAVNAGKSNPVQVNVHEYQAGLKRDNNIDKAEELKDKYGSFLLPTRAEEDNFFDIATKEFNLLFSA